MEEIIAKQFYKFIYKTDLSSSLPFPSIIAALCADAKIPSIKNDNLIPQEPAIVGEAMMRTRETRIYRRLDQQQEESRRSFEAINTRMDRMDDQLSFLCYSNQLVNETMHREEEMNQERMRYDQILQEVAAQQAREANKCETREVVPDSEEEEGSEELHSSAFEE
ncbi:hypothetical protein PIB30_094571, partial [Stylosanthes scabra]|nr:hypothetical protein [Stylosanthes scabra]